MDDLIKRLRSESIVERIDLANEAADEIERLRGELAQAVGEMADQGPYIDKLRARNVELRAALAAQPAPAAVPPDDVGLPPKYMLAKLQMVMPLFQEARDALPIMTEVQRKLHGVSPTLADRMDAAGTFSLDDWIAAAGDKP